MLMLVVYPPASSCRRDDDFLVIGANRVPSMKICLSLSINILVVNEIGASS